MNGRANGHVNGHVNGNGNRNCTSSRDELPHDMFTVIRSTGTARTGRLAFPARRLLDTPHYLANTSRGVVPHTTQDTFVRDTDINGLYIALEDFIENAPKGVPPLYSFRPPDGASPLRRFIAAPDDSLLVLGARRASPIAAPDATSNTNKTVSICTAVGFRALKADDYAKQAEGLQADILIALGDIPYERALGNKRIEKATDRNIAWLEEHVLRRSTHNAAPAKLFASLLPVSCAKQQYYVDELAGRFADHVSGLAIYDLDSLDDLPNELSHLPRLSFATPKTPRDVLYQIDLGLDVFVIPFVGAATDAGIALDFEFGTLSTSASNHDEGDNKPRKDTAQVLPLGIDMWHESHAVDVSPLARRCRCYACTNHHRAYLQHLLAAKEMLGWVLLQIHNHHVMDRFFASIRRSIAMDSFKDDVTHFEQKYESLLPAKTGQGPRVRGYDYKSQGPGELKKNSKAHAPFKMLNVGEEHLNGSVSPNLEANADDLQSVGFAIKES